MTKVLIVPNNSANFKAEHLVRLGFMEATYGAKHPPAMGC